ncbi:MAG: F0F1 ATP synthase subunit epsilon [SAR202 cluster bacterium]|nr:F0F1 ATP synthase subunit epsilon [SAR202 cluster bacterium]
MATMRLEIITAERLLFDGQVDALVAPGTEGELGILPHHAALMTMLQEGELRYRVGTREDYLTVSGGFMEVTGGHVIVLADAAERVEEIDEARALEAMRRTQERIASRAEDIELEQELHALRRAQLRVSAVRRHRRPPTIPSGPSSTSRPS